MTNSICKIDENGNKCWYNDKGDLHRENDLPALELVSGDKHWFLNGEMHRETGPACEYADGNKIWYLNGERHRVDGPAVEHADGSKEWWVDDERVDCNDNDTFLRMMKLKWAW